MRISMHARLSCLVLLLSACAEDGTPAPDASPGGLRPAQPPGHGDDTPPIDDGDTGLPDGGDTDTPPTDTGTGDDPAAPIRFVVLGDAGKGNDTQFAVADAIGTVCAANGCNFALYLGDNFYSDGVSAIDDVQFEEKFELPYADLSFPFHVVAGNHDYGGGGGGYDEWRIALEVAYTAHSQKWSMPAAYYSFTEGNTSFFALDSTAIDWGNTSQQAGWLPGEIAAAQSPWKLAFGHHPYLSNGSHGNANDNLGPFVESYLCGQVDVYFSGHDHNLQWLESSCPGTEFIVSGGGGAGTYALDGSNPSHFESASNGFLWVEIDGDTLTGVFYDASGAELHRKTITQ